MKSKKRRRKRKQTSQMQTFITEPVNNKSLLGPDMISDAESIGREGNNCLSRDT